MSVNEDDHFIQEKKKRAILLVLSVGALLKIQRHVIMEYMQEVKSKGKVQKESKEMLLLMELSKEYRMFLFLTTA